MSPSLPPPPDPAPDPREEGRTAPDLRGDRRDAPHARGDGLHAREPAGEEALEATDAPEATVPTPLPLLLSILLVAAGGFGGALARYELELVMPAGTGAFPLATWVANVSGALALGFLLTVATGRWAGAPWAVAGRPLLATGFIGAYTTWSTYMVETVQLAHHGDPALALGYLAASLAAGLLAAGVGVTVGQRVQRRPAYPTPDRHPA